MADDAAADDVRPPGLVMSQMLSGYWIFDEAMVGVLGAESAAMCDAHDFTGLGTLVDVGGGNGSLLVTVLPA